MIKCASVKGNGRVKVTFAVQVRWFNDEAADAYESNGMGADNFIVDLTTAP